MKSPNQPQWSLHPEHAAHSVVTKRDTSGYGPSPPHNEAREALFGPDDWETPPFAHTDHRWPKSRDIKSLIRIIHTKGGPRQGTIIQTRSAVALQVGKVKLTNRAFGGSIAHGDAETLRAARALPGESLPGTHKKMVLIAGPCRGKPNGVLWSAAVGRPKNLASTLVWGGAWKSGRVLWQLKRARALPGLSVPRRTCTDEKLPLCVRQVHTNKVWLST